MSRSVQELLNIVIVGHVDHGKSTLVGRLLHDTGSLTDGKTEELESISRARGLKDIEWSFALDAFQAERDQNVTIDTTRVHFRSENRSYVVIDAPGHREFLSNMLSGASHADAAILVVDATEGLQEQTRRHAYLLHMIGIRHVIVAVNKMDAMGYDPDRFSELASRIADYLGGLDMQMAAIIPVSAAQGDMIAARMNSMAWYQGPTLLEALDGLPSNHRDINAPSRFLVQDVYRMGTDRMIVGRVLSGQLSQGDLARVLPSGVDIQVDRFHVWPEDPHKTVAFAGESMALTVTDKVFIERGDVIAARSDMLASTRVLLAFVFWLGDKLLKAGHSYKMKCGTVETQVVVEEIVHVMDVQTLSQGQGGSLVRHDIGYIRMRAHDRIVLCDDGPMKNIVLYDGFDIVGGGRIDIATSSAQSEASAISHVYTVDHLVDTPARAQQMGHQGGVFWLTGLSGAGKSTLAMQIERELFARGYHTYVLDGDNIRNGLCSDLGFSADDRRENIRRVGEVASLMASSGLIVITAFISPFRDDRLRARQASGGRFHEIFIKAGLPICEARDPKGLYRKARAGLLPDFTGIDSPYEPPENADLVLDTERADIDDCVGQALAYIEQHVRLPETQQRKDQVRAF